MKLLAPVNSLESCKAQIDSGADEIYLGSRVVIFKNFHFSARSQLNNDGQYIMPTKDELREIVAYAHDRRVYVCFTANVGSFSDYIQGEINIEKEYVDYVLDGIECGVDSVIVSDIGLLYLLHEMKLPVELHAGTGLDTMSASQILFLKELGVSRTILSFRIDYSELKEIMREKPMAIEIFGFGGCSCCTFCNLGHGLNLGIPCKNKYYYNNSQQPSYFLDSPTTCSLCSLWELNNLGIDSLKIVGREQFYKQVTPITELFRKVIDLAKKSGSREFNSELPNIIPLWWKRSVCAKKQCKYNDRDNQYCV